MTMHHFQIRYQTRIVARRLAALVVGSLAIGTFAATAKAQQSNTAPSVSSAQATAVPADDRIRIAEALRLATEVGDELWSGWSRIPFAILLVTPDREFLLRHPSPSKDFTRVGYDSLLATEVYTRPRVHPTNLLATFPAVNGVSTIVVGQPAMTKKSSTAWVLTLLHEHFHQMQSSHPDYNAKVSALGLSRGDQTGMWMLNFPFPYDSTSVQGPFAAYTARLLRALTAKPLTIGGTNRDVVRDLVDARTQLRAALTPDDDRYLDFQSWQEGVSRYTQLKVARLAARTFTPSSAFTALPDYLTFAAEADTQERAIREELTHLTLGGARRVLFYSTGAATALLLDRINPSWRAHYFDSLFTLEPSFR